MAELPRLHGCATLFFIAGFARWLANRLPLKLSPRFPQMTDDGKSSREVRWFLHDLSGRMVWLFARDEHHAASRWQEFYSTPPVGGLIYRQEKN